MRTETGETQHNAHLLGFFRRIARLLCNRIRPVFVFDGATPALKLATVASRRQQRGRADAKLSRVAERLLLNQIKMHALNQAQQAELEGRVKAPSKPDSPGEDASLSADEAEAVARAHPTWRVGIDDEEEEEAEDDEEEAELPDVLTRGEDGDTLDVQALAALPVSVQLETIARMREQAFAANRQKLQAASDGTPSAFSALQMQTYLSTGRVKRQLNALLREQGGGEAAEGGAAAEVSAPAGGLFAQRIAGDAVRLMF